MFGWNSQSFSGVDVRIGEGARTPHFVLVSVGVLQLVVATAKAGIHGLEASDICIRSACLALIKLLRTWNVIPNIYILRWLFYYFTPYLVERSQHTFRQV